MKQRIWFWGTLTLWFLLGAVGLSRAILWGPEKLLRRDIQTFRGYVNNAVLQGEVWSTPGNLDEVADAMESEWSSEGWHPSGDGPDFFPLLLNGLPLDPEVAEVFHRCARIHLFERSRCYRILGLLQTFPGPTVSALTLEVPEQALETTRKRPSSAAPVAPPKGVETTDIGCQAFQGTFWSFKATSTPPDLTDWCQIHSIALSSLPNCFGTGFVATHLGQKYLLVVQPAEHNPQWVWAKLPVPE